MDEKMDERESASRQVLSTETTGARRGEENCEDGPDWKKGEGEGEMGACGNEKKMREMEMQ